MKRLLLIISLLLITSPAFADWFLTWDTVDSATGYLVSYTSGTSSYVKDTGSSSSINLNNLNIEILIPYTYTVKAYNDYGLSVASNSVDFVRPEFTLDTENLPEFIIIIPDGINTVTIKRD